jgi:hypothetical protein
MIDSPFLFLIDLLKPVPKKRNKKAGYSLFSLTAGVEPRTIN